VVKRLCEEAGRLASEKEGLSLALLEQASKFTVIEAGARHSQQTQAAHSTKLAKALAEEERRSKADRKVAAAHAKRTSALFEERLSVAQQDAVSARAEIEQLQQSVELMRGSAAAKVFDRKKSLHSPEAFAALSSDAQRQARSRALQFLGAFFDTQEHWRGHDIATALQRKGLLEELWDSREMWVLRMEWARDLHGVCTSHHWGAKFGLYLVITEHLSKSQIGRIAQVEFPPAPPRP